MRCGGVNPALRAFGSGYINQDAVEFEVIGTAPIREVHLGMGVLIDAFEAARAWLAALP